MINTFFINITNLKWNEIKVFLSNMDENVVFQINSLKNEKDRCASLLGKMLIFFFLNNNILYAHKLPEIKQTRFGKPYLLNYKFLNFNISHSDDIVGCSFSDNCLIGLDIEKIKPINIKEYSEIFSNEEYKYILSSNDPIYSFYALWTRKESFIKAIGFGFSLQPKSINVLKNPILYHDMRFYTNTANINSSYIQTIVSNRIQKNHSQELFMNDLLI